MTVKSATAGRARQPPEFTEIHLI